MWFDCEIICAGIPALGVNPTKEFHCSITEGPVPNRSLVLLEHLPEHWKKESSGLIKPFGLGKRG